MDLFCCLLPCGPDTHRLKIKGADQGGTESSKAEGWDKHFKKGREGCYDLDGECRTLKILVYKMCILGGVKNH